MRGITIAAFRVHHPARRFSTCTGNFRADCYGQPGSKLLGQHIHALRCNVARIFVQLLAATGKRKTARPFLQRAVFKPARQQIAHHFTAHRKILRTMVQHCSAHAP